MAADEFKKREFVRVNVQLPVRYKFLSTIEEKKDDAIYKGTTANISAGGMLLNGPLPDNDWVVDLLLSRIAIGINIFLPDSKVPVKALGRVAWVESVTEQGTCAMGLVFREMTRESRDRIVQLIIQSELP